MRQEVPRLVEFKFTTDAVLVKTVGNIMVLPVCEATLEEFVCWPLGCDYLGVQLSSAVVTLCFLASGFEAQILTLVLPLPNVM